MTRRAIRRPTRNVPRCNAAAFGALALLLFSPREVDGSVPRRGEQSAYKRGCVTGTERGEKGLFRRGPVPKWATTGRQWLANARSRHGSDSVGFYPTLCLVVASRRACVGDSHILPLSSPAMLLNGHRAPVCTAHLPQPCTQELHRTSPTGGQYFVCQIPHTHRVTSAAPAQNGTDERR